MSRIDTVKYLIGENDVYESIQKDRATGNLVVVESNSNHTRLIEDCLKDIYERLEAMQKLKDKVKSLEARVKLLESHDDGSTLVN